MLSELRDRLYKFPVSVSRFRDPTFIDSINYVLKITWVDVQPYGSGGYEVRRRWLCGPQRISFDKKDFDVKAEKYIGVFQKNAISKIIC